MKRNLLSSTLLGCCAAVFACSAAFGQPDNPCGRDWNTPLKEITGTITKAYHSYMRGTGKKGLHLDVAVDGSKETVTVHVFPTNCITNNPDLFKFKKGERVTATGSEFSTQAGMQQNICAQSVSSHRLSDLRDEQNGSLNTSYCQPKNICEEQCRKRRSYEKCMEMCSGIANQGRGPRGFRPGPR